MDSYYTIIILSRSLPSGRGVKREKWRKRVYRVYTLEVRSSCDQSFMFQWILPTDSSPLTTTRPCSRKLFLVRLKVYHFFSASDPLCIASLICLCIVKGLSQQCVSYMYERCHQDESYNSFHSE